MRTGDRILVIAILLLCFSVTANLSIQWIGLSNYNMTSDNPLTSGDSTATFDDLLTVLDKRQQKLMVKDKAFSHVVMQSARSTLLLCESQFNESRWNCSSLRQLPEVSPELQAGTREQAYVYALSTAILTADLAKACSYGYLRSCECTNVRSSQTKIQAAKHFLWKGCELNLKPAMSLSKRFTDSKLARYVKKGQTGTNDVDSTRDAGRGPHLQKLNSALVNLHNTFIGRQTIRDSVVKRCKCHGISGSCEVKTCWRDIDFPQAERNLMERYVSAVHYITPSPEESEAEGDNSRSSGVEKRELDVTSNRLIFNMVSSDYCNFNAITGSLGTAGRKCGDGHGDVCKSMCCGRGSYAVTKTKTERCRCKHIWCCSVQCDSCDVTTTELYCN